MKITRIQVRNYRGISALDAEIPESGAVAKGRNGSGKTSLLKAVRAALAAQDVGPDAIRLGADKAEIVIDLGALAVRRAITAKGSTLTVKDGGATVASPQTALRELLGTSPIDPLDLFLAPPKERRARILGALPVTVTSAELRRWAPDLDEGTDCSGHGLEVVGRVRARYYAERTSANASAKAAKGDAERAADAARRAEASVPADAMPVDQADAALAKARGELAALEARAADAARTTERTAKTRARITELRARAESERELAADPPAEADLERARAEQRTAEAEFDRLRAELAKAEVRLRAAEQALDRLVTQQATADADRDRAHDLDAQAAELESAIADAGPAGVTPADLDVARRAVTDGEAARTGAQARAASLAAVDAAKAARDRAASAEAEATRLDGIVDALTNEAPRALLAASDSIPGLSLDGDEIALDGVRLDGLCGAEQMKLAIEIARRANARSKILVVDGLERVDPEQYARFVELATAGGYQLIGSRVDRGEVVLEAVAADDFA